MRSHLLADPWLETEVALLEDASAVDFLVVFFLKAGRHRFLVEILVFGARQSVSPLMDPSSRDTYISLHSPAGYGEIPPGNNLCWPRLVLLLLALPGSLVVHVRATREVRMARPFGQGSRVW